MSAPFVALMVATNNFGAGGFYPKEEERRRRTPYHYPSTSTHDPLFKYSGYPKMSREMTADYLALLKELHGKELGRRDEVNTPSRDSHAPIHSFRNNDDLSAILKMATKPTPTKHNKSLYFYAALTGLLAGGIFIGWLAN